MSWLKDDTLRTLGGLSPARFLQDYWQRKPLFVKNAVPELAGLLDGNDLAGLAIDPDVESRIVARNGAAELAKSWSLRRGPFKTADFRKLPKKDWTLLVQAVDHRLPALAELLDRFSFLPQWRIDDVMVSYAVDGGGVGPHYDSYDVFLIQGSGTRLWRVGPEVSDADLMPHADLRILKKMPVTEEFLCEPGDLLYLPPGVAHWGIAQGECMTYSVGFRAPADREMLDGLCSYLIDRIPAGQRYGDAGLATPEHAGELPAATVAAFRNRLTALLDQPALLADFLGRVFSEPKYGNHSVAAPARRYSAASLAKKLAAATEVRRHEASRLLLVGSTLYVDGEAVPVAPAALPLATTLADRRVLPAAQLQPFCDPASTEPAATKIIGTATPQALLLHLFNSGHLYFT